MDAVNFPANLTTAYALYARVLADVDRVVPRSLGTPTQQRVLRALLASPGLVDAEIVRALGLQSSHLSRVMTQLTQAGFIASQPTPHHVSQKLRFLTPEGAARARQIDEAYHAAALRQFDLLSAAERDFLFDAAVVPRSHGDDASERSPEVHRVTVAEFQWIFEHALATGNITRKGAAMTARNLMLHTAQPEEWGMGWTAKRLGHTVGACLATFNADLLTAEIWFCYVDPASRGLGLGLQLLTNRIDDARRWTALNMTAMAVRQSAAGRLLNKRGFVAEKPLRRAQKRFLGEPAVRFTLKFPLV